MSENDFSDEPQNIQKPTLSKIKNTTDNKWSWLIVAGAIGLMVYFSQYYANRLTNEGIVGTILIAMAGVWWCVQKAWPVFILVFIWWLFETTVKDSVRDGIKDALGDYFIRDEIKKMIKESICGYSSNGTLREVIIEAMGSCDFQDALKETIKEAVAEAIEESKDL